MGKYSIDAFEVHPLVKLRPLVTKPEEHAYQLLELHQSELEPGSGAFLAPPAAEGEQVVLLLHLDEKQDLTDACGFIRRMGRCYEGGKALAGVVVTGGAFAGAILDQLVQAYRQGFENTFLLAEPGTALAECCARMGVPFGLWLELDRGILPLRRETARSGLARNWEKYPVYIHSGRELTPEERDAAHRWHASGADVPALLGPRMTLRRLMFPRDLTAGGPMPLRLWWQNLGTAPMYREAEVCLELHDGEERFPIGVPEAMFRPGMGDSTVNTTARLPEVCGTFDLRCGLRSRGKMWKLCMEAPEEDGMYTVGQVTLDDVPRPWLAAMWEENYADGYYPLEDPAQPE